jgi:flavin-dependent dehydrogenase
MIRNDVPIVILGAGPAGCAAARLLASWGHDVVVLGRRGSGERSLGESLPPSCVALLNRIGIADLDAGGFLRSTGNTVRWGGAQQRVEPFAAGQHGYQVERAAFDAFLAREAAGAGADVRLGANVTGVAMRAGAIVAYEQDGKASELRADWVLDCTGRASIIARDGWRRPEPASRTTAIVGVWESDAWPNAEPSHTIVESSEDGWAWSVPVSARRRYVTLMVDPTLDRVASRDGLQQAYLEQLRGTRGLAPLVEGASLVASVFARDASPYTARSFAEPGVLLVGDAGSFVDPLSSFGIKKALASAWLGSVVVHSILTDATIRDAALGLFDARERAMYDALRRSAAALARDAAGAYSTSFWESRAVAASDPDRTLEPDVAALRGDPDVLRALDQLRGRETIALRRTALVQRTARATVRNSRVVLEEHLLVPAFPDGVRWVRNVDLVHLIDLAPAHDQVPDLFDAYNRSAPPVPLPDFLGALSLLVGKDFLEITAAADSSSNAEDAGAAKAK